MAKQQKYSTYLLLCLVAIIWGIIGYKIIKARNGDDFSSSIKWKSDVAAQDSSYSMKLNYRDPFLGIEHSSKPISKKGKVATIKKTASPTVSYAALLSSIRARITYNGLVVNRTKNGKLGIILLKGEVLHVSLQSKVDSLQVVSIGNDSLTFKGKFTYVIKRVQ